jgi:multiple antibiotic resistance protein
LLFHRSWPNHHRGDGVSLRDFQIADGLILFLFVAMIVISERQESWELGTEAKTRQGSPSILSPFHLAGPGAMLTVVLLTDNSRFSNLEQLLTTATVAVVLAITWVMLLLANPIARVIRPHGANVLKRIMGMILATVAVKIVLGGIPDGLHLPGNALMMLVRRGPPQWQALRA